MEFSDPKLNPIWQKVQSDTRLKIEDIRVLYASHDLVGLGWMAKQAKEKRWGKQAFYVLNQKLEPTNVCVLSCKFCDFATKRKEPNAYELTVEEMVQKCSGDISEIHISGGMPPEWTLENYLGIIRALRKAYPNVGIKAFTAVEVEWAARISKLSIESVLKQFKEAGLTALPGGGAEVFSERVRAELFPFKIGAKEWLEVHRTAHQLGIPTNATLLYGHIETPEECWTHLQLLRDLQDESLAGRHPRVGGDPATLTPLDPRFRGGDGTSAAFMSFIPLAFQPGTTGLAVQPPTVVQDLKLLAISRLFLDNFPHIKAYWITLGEETASTALHWGADDIDGTIGGERIMHDAGAKSPTQMARERLEELITEAGCVPVERDALYNVRQTPTVRIGYIPYLNMAPFHQGFGPEPVKIGDCEFTFLPMSPRVLGVEADKGTIDAGAMSIVDTFRLADTFESLGTYGIGLKQAAQSVLVFSKKPLSELEGVCSVTDDTSTSFRLLQILLEQRYNRTNVRYGRIASSMLFDGEGEAILLIGDEALRAQKEGIKGFPIVSDLGAEWMSWQGTPFVFARWVVRKTLADKHKQIIEESIKNSLKSNRIGNNQQVDYWANFVYKLSPSHLEAIEKFKSLIQTSSPAGVSGGSMDNLKPLDPGLRHAGVTTGRKYV